MSNSSNLISFLVISLYENLSPDWQKTFDITATDISKMAIQYAKNALYTQYEVQRGVPTRLLNKYFTQKELNWEVKEEFLKHVRYATENLCQPDYKVRKFDIVLCRNATIYMDAEKVRKIYEHFHKCMNPESYIIIGNSERMSKHADLFESIKTSAGNIYKRVT